MQDQVPSWASRFRQTHTPETKVGSLPLLFGVSPYVNMRRLPPHPQVPLVPPSLSPHRVPFKITNIKKESGREGGNDHPQARRLLASWQGQGQRGALASAQARTRVPSPGEGAPAGRGLHRSRLQTVAELVVIKCAGGGGGGWGACGGGERTRQDVGGLGPPARRGAPS